MDISACNRIEGRVTDLKKGKATTNVRIETPLGEITAVVTSSSVEALELEAGNAVSALFREVDVMLMTGGGAISTRNRFPGRILDIKKGGVTAELSLDIGGGGRIIAVVARTAAEEMGLDVGASLVACVREGDLLLAKAGALSVRNQLAGTIASLRPGTVTTELTIDTAEGEIFALLARSVAEEMRLGVGDRVAAVVRERDFLVRR